MRSVYYLLTVGRGENFRMGTFIAMTVLCIVVPYLIGSINPAIIFSKIFYHDDVRKHGSGNAGATNTLRTYGKKMSAAVLLCDMLKAAIAVAFGCIMINHQYGGAMAGFFVVFGHMFPIYYKFKGGKGVACAAVVALMMSPISMLICLVIFVIIVLGTKFVSLGSVVGIAFYPLIVSRFLPPQRQGAIALFGFLMAAFVIFMHRSNLKRIMNKEESKLSFKKKKKETEAQQEQEPEAAPEKIYTAEDFVECACGRTIPVTRERCAYCKKKNPAFVPSDEWDALKAEKKSKNKNKKKK
ncbi:MAG: glycerol-3-phosphate 1-O-acyltransferase PlsY [Ruminococcaceae bacterium]|nr:glycerol-3-phosphate 1-O-acyltransferase PlsY [Oscillospiraceae bacterium]